eukprot:TRINITY_DN23173_c0_g1_i1.p1 TRINITY_DN23173_c0_g1~~TRINITY_DN23173_c0_g1_i1.p1  ORF type:complete len:150 (+),score=20.27 TRINITY_DN23173_c0_g1_i1:99-548(+)
MCIRDSINAEYMGYFLMGKECQGTLHKDIKKRAPKHITNIEEITCEFTKQWCSEYIRKEHVIEDGKITVIVRTPGKRDVSIMMKELKIKENSYASILRLLKCRGAVSKACRWYFFQALRQCLFPGQFQKGYFQFWRSINAFIDSPRSVK